MCGSRWKVTDCGPTTAMKKAKTEGANEIENRKEHQIISRNSC